MNVKEVSAIRLGTLIITRILGFLLIGIILNLIFVYFLIPSIRSVVNIPTEEASVFYKAFFLIIGSCIVGLFLIIMPILYFITGKRYAIRLAIAYIIFKQKTLFIEILLDKIMTIIKNDKILFDFYQKEGWAKTIKKVIPELKQKSNTFHFTLKVAVRFVLRRFRRKKIEKLLTELPISSLDHFSFSDQERIKIEKFVNDNYSIPTFRPFIFLLILNITLFIGIKYLPL